LSGLGDEESFRAQLGNVCRALEADGDFSVARGGVLHASPVRAVMLDEGTHRIVTSLPTRALGPRLPGTLELDGVHRTHRSAPDRPGEFETTIDSLGGVVLSVEAWAGLDRRQSPHADGAWIRNLEQRLQWHPEAQGSLERDGALEWATLELSDDGPRWRRASGTPTRLWRARSRHRRWLFAWTASEQPPTVSEFVSLNDDDASRTVFAVARAADRPVRPRLERQGDECRLWIREWLPRAEHRFLSALGSCEYIDRLATWTFPAGRESQVVATLVKRLGLQISDAEGTR